VDAPLLHEVIETRLDGERLFAEAFRDSPAAVWLDGIAEGSRFSVLGDDSGPLAHRLTYDAAARRITITDRAGTQVREGRLFDHLRALPRAPGVPDLPFALGYCGYFGYELRQDCGSPVRHRSPFADAQLLYLDRAVVLDHQEGRAHLLALPHPENERWLREMRLTNLPEVEAATPSAGRVTWRDSRETYRAKVMAAQEHLAAGESYELCLTNQASVRCPEDPFTVYQQLRRVNPAPYAAFLRLPGIAILSSSPELFLKVDRDGGVTARPIKGTRRRTAGDVGVVEDLRSSEKDRSENLMITDLLRNDLGRVCAIGSVRVPSLFAVESFATVHQLVSTVTGRLRPELGAIDLLEAAFPPGSMTGAPKLRSMALLEALEGAPRGPYSGAIGYLSRCGAAQLSVVIRTAVIADGSATIGVGGAVVALSDPDAEVAEMELKAEAVLTALGAGERSRPT
jgi:para-aminobenzoate synthetase